MCNTAWNYTGRETENFMSKITRFDVSKGSVLRYLELHGTTWGEIEIFGEMIKRYYNGLKKFSIRAGDVWDVSMIQDYLKSVFTWIWGETTLNFVYKEQHLHHKFGGDSFLQTNVCVTSDMPFSRQKTDMLVNTKPTISDLLERIEKQKRPKRPKPPKSTVTDFEELYEDYKRSKVIFENQLRKYKVGRTLLLQDDVSYEDVEKVLGSVDSDQTKMSTIFSKLHSERQLDEYHSFTFVPYLNVNPCRKDQLNCFTGFTLARFRNSSGDIRKTKVWDWLWISLCDRKEYKMNYILNYFAHKLQYGHKKVKKFLLLFGSKTGTGKSTIRIFLDRIFDECVLFVDSIEDFTGTYTGQQFGKLFCIIDDIQKWSKKTSSDLKSRITSDTFRLRKMYSDPITMPSYLDLITSSNSRTPTFIGRDDRRTELIEINPELKGNTKFWTELYHEFDNKQVMGSWFQFLATRDLQGVVFDENYRFSEVGLAKQKMLSLISAFRFLVDYFSRDDFLFHRYAKHDNPKLFEHIEFKIWGGERTITIKKELLYVMYLRWVKLTSEVNKRKYNNFYTDLKDINHHVGRYNISGAAGTRTTGIRLSVSRLKEGLGEYLNIDPESIEVGWEISNPEIWEVLERNEFPNELYDGNFIDPM
jgi:hypothetical protein